jgi:hypothetical protein
VGGCYFVVNSNVEARKLFLFLEPCLSLFFQLAGFLFSEINCCWEPNVYKDNELLIEKIDLIFLERKVVKAVLNTCTCLRSVLL